MLKSRFIATVDAGLIANLMKFEPRRFTDNPLKWQNFNVSEQKFAVQIKAPLKQKVDPQTIYNICVYFQPSEPIRGGGKTMDRWYAFLRQTEEAEVEAKLCFFEHDNDKEVVFDGEQPLWLQRIKGASTKGVLYFAPASGECQPRATDEVGVEELFKQSCFLEIPLGLKAEQKSGGVKYSINGVDLYDNRTDRFCQFGLVRYVKRTIGERSFSYYEIADSNTEPDSVTHQLVMNGSIEISELS